MTVKPYKVHYTVTAFGSTISYTAEYEDEKLAAEFVAQIQKGTWPTTQVLYTEGFIA